MPSSDAPPATFDEGSAGTSGGLVEASSPWVSGVAWIVCQLASSDDRSESLRWWRHDINAARWSL